MSDLKSEAILKGFSGTYRLDYLVERLSRFLRSTKRTLILQSLTSKQRCCLYSLCKDKKVTVTKHQKILFECPSQNHYERCRCKGTGWLTKNQTAEVCSRCEGHGRDSRYEGYGGMNDIGGLCNDCNGSGKPRGWYRNGVTLMKS